MNKKFLIGIMMCGALLTACEKFDVPEMTEPKYDGTANITIAQLKQLHTQSGVIDSLDQDYVFECIVVGNDVSGNIFKKLYVQDSTGGYEVALDKAGLYNTYKVGQRLFITCKGMVIGDYGGLSQIGYTFFDDQGKAQVGRVPDIFISKHLHKDGFPDANAIQPYLISSAADLTEDKINCLVKFTDAVFVDAGVKLFAPKDESAQGGAINRVFNTPSGQVTLRTSTYADFAADTIPVGTCEMVGILTKFNNTWQFILRTKKDLKITSSTALPVGSGTESDPYNVSKAFLNSDGATGWVTGYIVGCVKGYPSAIEAEFTAPFTEKTTLLIADDANETHLSACYRIQLTNATLQSALNLVDNPSNLGRKVKLHGQLTDYYGGRGVRGTDYYRF